MPALDLRELAAIFLGGMAGALARAGLAEAFPSAHDRWPWVTFAVNIAGAALLGYVVTRLQERLPLSAYRRPLLGTGFCGALTTFSTFGFETVRLAQDGWVKASVANVLLGVGLSLTACALGWWVTAALV